MQDEEVLLVKFLENFLTLGYRPLIWDLIVDYLVVLQQDADAR